MTSLHQLLVDDGAAERERDEQVQHVAEALAVLYEAIGPEPEWQVEAACRGQTSVMFPGRGQDVRPAKALCASCPVSAECETWATASGREQGGVLAGRAESSRATWPKLVPLVELEQRFGPVPGNDVAELEDGTCLCCRHTPVGANDRIRAGLCMACYRAWSRHTAALDGKPDRAEFIAGRRARLAIA